MEKHKLTSEEIGKLQDILVQTCIDFINENNIDDLEEVDFRVDMLQESAKYGSWQACTDSSISGYGINGDNACDERILLHSYC